MQKMLATTQEAAQAQHGAAAYGKAAVESWLPEASLKQKVNQLMFALQESEAFASLGWSCHAWENVISQASTVEAAAQVQEPAVVLNMSQCGFDCFVLLSCKCKCHMCHALT